MRTMLFAVLAVITLPAAAQTSDKSKDDPNKMICRSEPTIGSRLQSQRTCLTRAQWKQQQDEQRRSVERVQFQRSLKGG